MLGCLNLRNGTFSFQTEMQSSTFIDFINVSKDDCSLSVIIEMIEAGYTHRVGKHQDLWGLPGHCGKAVGHFMSGTQKPVL